MKQLLLAVLFTFICFTIQAQYNQDIIIEPLLKTDSTSIGQKIDFPNSQEDEITVLKITIPPGHSTGWHTHEFPLVAYIQSGTLTVEFENNRSMSFSANSAFAETINTLHNGTNKGTENVVLLAFFMGVEGKPLSVHKEMIKMVEKEE